MRTFLACEIPEALSAALDARLRSLRSTVPRARWVEPAAMHLTLVFLGEIDEPSVSRLQAELEPLFAPEAPLTMKLGWAGAFPAGRPARVVWLAVETGRDLAPLCARAADACRRAAGVEPDAKPFHPHLTLARCDPPWPARAVETLATACGGGFGEPFTVNEAVLFRSHLGRGGARHDALVRLPMAGVA